MGIKVGLLTTPGELPSFGYEVEAGIDKVVAIWKEELHLPASMMTPLKVEPDQVVGEHSEMPVEVLQFIPLHPSYIIP